MEAAVETIKVVIWPFTVLVAFFLFRNSISALLRPNESGKFRLKVGLTGVELERVAAEAAAVAVGSIKSIESGDVNRADVAKNIAEGLSVSLSPSPKTGSKNIIWVDDHPENNKYLIDVFQDLGIHVDISLHTKDAIEKLGKNKYDLLITDMSRPPEKEAGLAVVHFLKSSQLRIPVIIYAAYWASINKGRKDELGVLEITNDPSRVYALVLKTLLGN